MRKSNKTLVLCVLALVLTLSTNQVSLPTSASTQEMMEQEMLKFLDQPLPETIAGMNFTSTEDALPGALGALTFDVDHEILIGNETEEVITSHMVIINNQGQIVRELSYEGFRGFSDPQMFNETTLMMNRTPMGYLTFWNLDTNKQYTIEAINITQSGHHDWHYNPVTDTFVALGRDFADDPILEDTQIRLDAIWEFNWKGELLWEWNMSDWIDCSDPEFINDTQCMVDDHARARRGRRGGGPVERDYSHANGLYWDPEANILYLNNRHLDNAWAIEYPSGKVLWIAGRNGDFTMYDKYGNEKISLFYHSHGFYPIPGEPNKFITFDNGLHNGTAGPDDIPLSRIVEVEIDTDTWTMTETWSWTAPPDYYAHSWGIANRLPNGNRVGCFGHRSSLVEVTEDGEIAWEATFLPDAIYRGTRFQPHISLNAPEDLTCDRDVNDCQTIGWTGTSGFKASYQITKDGDMLVNKPWTTKKIYYDLPSDLAVGTHKYTLTVFDLAGQSISDTVKVTVEAPMTVFEIMPIVGVPVVLTVGLAMVGLTKLLRRKRPRA